MLCWENGKLEWLIKERVDNDEDLNFFRALIPYVKQLPSAQKKLFLKSQFQKMVADEMGTLQINLHHAWALSTAPTRTVLITVRL